MIGHGEILPIVQSSAAQIVVRCGETQFAHQMQGTFGKNTEAGDVASVLGNLRFDEDDVHLAIARDAESGMKIATAGRGLEHAVRWAHVTRAMSGADYWRRKAEALLSIHRESAIRFSTIGILESHFTATTALPMATFPVES